MSERILTLEHTVQELQRELEYIRPRLPSGGQPRRTRTARTYDNGLYPLEPLGPVGPVVGTATAGSSTTITLDSSAPAIDDELNARAIRLTGGTGKGQTDTVSDYVGSSRLLTVSGGFSPDPDATTKYSVEIWYPIIFLDKHADDRQTASRRTAANFGGRYLPPGTRIEVVEIEGDWYAVEDSGESPVIVPKTTITAATRVVRGGSDKFTPGTGEGYLHRYDSSLDEITPMLDAVGNPVFKRIRNLRSVAFEPNPFTPGFLMQDGSTFDMQDGSPFEFQRDSSSTDFLGPGNKPLSTVEDRAGDLYLPDDESTQEATRLLRAIVADPAGIGPDDDGSIWLFEDQQLDNAAQSGSTSTTIKLAANSSTINGFYNEWVVRLITGRGSGQSRWIKSYNGTTKIATIGAVGDVSYPWADNEVPLAGTAYKLERLSVSTGHWNQAEASGRLLFQYEECFVQPVRSHSNQYTIVRGADKSLLRATVDESGGIAPNSQGTIILSDSGRTTTGIWDHATADKRIDRFGQISVAYEKTIPVGGPAIDEGRLYRIWGADCTALSDSPP